MAAQSDILRVSRRAYVTRKVSLSAALKFHVCRQVSLHLVRSAALWTLDRRLHRANRMYPRDVTPEHVAPPES